MKPDLNSLSGYFRNAMAFVYVLAGVFLIFFYPDTPSISDTLKIVMGIAMILYGFYRIYRVYLSIKIDNEK